MQTKDAQLTCTSGKFKRLQYFGGMLLTEQDFQEEQNYFRAKLRLHNRLHGHGVVCGLELKAKCIKVDGNPVWKIFIEPGVALDCAGNEIVVCQPQRVDIESKIRELYQSCQSIDPLPTLYVGIKYCECKSDLEAQYATDCADDAPLRDFSRVREGYTVQIFTEAELPQCCKPEDCWPDDHEKEAKQACWELTGCCESECCPVLLGCIKDYLSQESWRTEIQNLDIRCFSEETIDRCCKPSYADADSSNRHDQWQRQKQVAMITACKDFGWIDLSAIVGKSQAHAKKCLKDKEFPSPTITKMTNVTSPEERRTLMTRISAAVSCVPSNSAIELILDKDGCVLFALATLSRD